jgi:hypothetical protein
MIEINNKQRLFCEAYCGDEVSAMRIAGYEGTDTFLSARGKELLAQPLIREAIAQRSKYIASTTKIIATREERQAFWTSLMRNEDPNAKPSFNEKGVSKPPEDLPLPMRLKASELLGKSETDFLERVDINHNVSITDVIKEAYTIPMEDINAIEVEYERIYAKKKSLVVEEQSDGSVCMGDSDTTESEGQGTGNGGSTLGDFI